MMQRLDKAALRPLLRTCRQADKCPVQMVPLLGRPARQYCPVQHQTALLPAARFPFVEDAIWEANGGATEYSHPRPDGLPAAALSVRRHCRRAMALGLAYAPEARELMQRFGEAQHAFEVADASEMSFGEVEMALADVSERPASVGEHAPPQRQVFGEHMEINETSGLVLERIFASDPTPPAVGDILITHPISCVGQPGLDQSVILICEIDEVLGHVRGMAVNNPGRASVKEMLAASGEPSDELVLAGFDQALLDLQMGRGGDLSSGSLVEGLRWLHTLGDRVPGAVQVAPSMWLGGDFATLASQSEGISLATVRPLMGYAGWSQAQLAMELERGVWVRARATTPDAAIFFCMSDWQSSEAFARDPAPSLLWRAALQAAGCSCLAAFPRGPQADAGLKKLLENQYRSKAEETHDKNTSKLLGRVTQRGRTGDWILHHDFARFELLQHSGLLMVVLVIDDLFLDGSYVASGMQINNVMGTTIGPGGYFLNFSSYGVQINEGHEVMVLGMRGFLFVELLAVLGNCGGVLFDELLAVLVTDGVLVVHPSGPWLRGHSVRFLFDELMADQCRQRCGHAFCVPVGVLLAFCHLAEHLCITLAPNVDSEEPGALGGELGPESKFQWGHSSLANFNVVAEFALLGNKFAMQTILAASKHAFVRATSIINVEAFHVCITGIRYDELDGILILLIRFLLPFFFMVGMDLDRLISRLRRLQNRQRFTYRQPHWLARGAAKCAYLKVLCVSLDDLCGSRDSGDSFCTRVIALRVLLIMAEISSFCSAMYMLVGFFGTKHFREFALLKDGAHLAGVSFLLLLASTVLGETMSSIRLYPPNDAAATKVRPDGAGFLCAFIGLSVIMPAALSASLVECRSNALTASSTKSPRSQRAGSRPRNGNGRMVRAGSKAETRLLSVLAACEGSDLESTADSKRSDGNFGTNSSWTRTDQGDFCGIDLRMVGVGECRLAELQLKFEVLDKLKPRWKSLSQDGHRNFQVALSRAGWGMSLRQVARAVDSAASALRAVTDCSLREQIAAAEAGSGHLAARMAAEDEGLLGVGETSTARNRKHGSDSSDGEAPPEGFGLLRDVIEAFLNLDDLSSHLATPAVTRSRRSPQSQLARNQPRMEVKLDQNGKVWQQVVQLLQSSAWAPLRGIGAGHQHLGRASRAATALQRLVCAALAGHQDSDGQDASCFDTLRSVCDTCVPDVLIAVSLACRCSDWQQLLELAATASKLHAKVLVFLLDEDPSFESDNSPPSSFTDERWCELFEGAVAGGFVAPFSSSADEPSAAAAVAAARAEKWALRALCGWADIGSESEGIADDAPAPVTQGVKLFFLSARCARAVATAGLRSPSSVARLQSLRYSRRCLEAGGEVAAAGLGDPERLLAALCRALALSGEEWGDWLEANSDNGAAVVRAAVRRVGLRSSQFVSFKPPLDRLRCCPQRLEDAMVAALATTSIGAEVDVPQRQTRELHRNWYKLIARSLEKACNSFAERSGT
ncbi:unnamed protein product [Polarella glacialis]|uniref:Uncharacterized protein n=1 Tax=Polarella glacialis TaxID=89957 RepID=A0A813K4Y9_POLGL|nr:unnamed protein product [Polarella glacialis]